MIKYAVKSTSRKSHLRAEENSSPRNNGVELFRISRGWEYITARKLFGSGVCRNDDTDDTFIALKAT